MEKLKVMSIFGTRPEAIKMAPIINELKNYNSINSVVCVTAQHREMLDQVLEIFKIKPDYDLDIMEQKQTLTKITAKAIQGLDDVLEKEKPDIILVHGDTSTTFCGALTAFYHNIKVGHVEAGLRTYDKYQPFPEEMNRCLTSTLTDLHFAPTSLSKSNLLKENFKADDIFITGNTVIDVLAHTIKEDYEFTNDTLKSINFKEKRIISMTAHRRENLGEPLENICKAIKKILEEFDDVEVIYPVHKNPVVVNTVHEILGNTKGIHLIEPLDLVDMHNMLSRSYLVMTDSGGLQEEVPSMGKPVLVLRNVTERPEGVEAGTLKLVGTDTKVIYESAKELLENKQSYDKMAEAKNPFGDGNASRRIIENILYYFGINKEKSDEFIAVNSTKKEGDNMNNNSQEERMLIFDMMDRGVIKASDAKYLIVAMNNYTSGNKKERLAVLDMLNRGVITVNDAKDLIVVTNTSNYQENNVTDKVNNFIDKANDVVDKVTGSVAESVVAAEPIIKNVANKFTSAFKNLAEDIKDDIQEAKSKKNDNKSKDLEELEKLDGVNESDDFKIINLDDLHINQELIENKDLEEHLNEELDEEDLSILDDIEKKVSLDALQNQLDAINDAESFLKNAFGDIDFDDDEDDEDI